MSHCRVKYLPLDITILLGQEGWKFAILESDELSIGQKVSVRLAIEV